MKTTRLPRPHEIRSDVGIPYTVGSLAARLRVLHWKQRLSH